MQRGVGRLMTVFALTLAVGLAGVAARAEDVKDGETVIRIGAVIDQTGPSTSPLYRKAVELAAVQVNQALTHRGSRVSIEVLFGDTKGNAALAQSEAIRLINQEHVVGLVGMTSGETVAINKLNYNPLSPAAYKVPVTCFQCSSGFINNPNTVEVDPLTQAAERDVDNWLFRVFYNANYEAAVLTQIALKGSGGDRNGDGRFKIGILADAGHKSLATAIAATLPSFYSGPSSTEIVYITGNFAADWARVVDGYNETTKQTDGEPDVVVMSMLPINATGGIKAYRAGGYQIPIYSNNSFRRNYILPVVGADADGLEGSSVELVDKSASGQDFLDAFQAFTGSGPELTSSGAYDCTVSLMLAALTASGDLHRPTPVTGADVRQGLTQINDPTAHKVRPNEQDFSFAAHLLRQGWPINYEGAYNPLDWNAVGDIFPPLVHWKVENGQFVEYESFQCDPQHPLCPAVQ